MLYSETNTREKAKSDVRRADEKAPVGRQESRQRAFSAGSPVLSAASSLLLVALVALSTYTHFQVTGALATLESRVGKLLEGATASGQSDGPSGDEGLSEPVAVRAANDSGKSEEDAQQLRQVEETLKKLTESVSRISAQLASASQSAPKAPPVLPPLPALPSPISGVAQPTARSNALAWKSGIPEESRTQANQVLREYAEQARAEIQAQHAAGTLDEAAMERIKRDTRMKAANELQSRLPAGVFDEMFPTEVEQSGM